MVRTRGHGAFCGLIPFLLGCPGAASAMLWINEFHYDNRGADTGEFVEIVVEAGAMVVSLGEVKLTLYNGADGKQYETHALDSFTVGEQTNGFQFYWEDIPGIQNGAPDGMALSQAGNLIEFISYEGYFDATDGPAAGATSMDIGVSETFETGAGLSLSRYGELGTDAVDYAWGAGEASPGRINALPVPPAVVLLASALAGIGFAVRRKALG